MAEDLSCAKNVVDIVKNRRDPAGDPIIKVYSYNPPTYAIYRTRDRLIVHYADMDDVKALQRRAVSPLAPMRGQINGLIDGWRHAGIRPDGGSAEEEIETGEGDSLWWLKPSKSEQFKRACRYDRRVADALITVLDEAGTPDSPLAPKSGQTLETAQTLLAQVKNDIIAERTSIARALYIRWALLMVAILLAATGLLASGVLDWIHAFGEPVDAVWSAVAGGSIGAFFSIAIGLKGREVVIDLQNRENQVDVMLRMLIGAIAGGVLYCLLASDLVSVKFVTQQQIVPIEGREAAYNDIIVFLIGFFAGFFERLVPKLLNETAFGTPEPAGQETPIAKADAPRAPDPLWKPADKVAIVDDAAAPADPPDPNDGAATDTATATEANTGEGAVPTVEGAAADDAGDEELGVAPERDGTKAV